MTSLSILSITDRNSKHPKNWGLKKGSDIYNSRNIKTILENVKEAPDNGYIFRNFLNGKSQYIRPDGEKGFHIDDQYCVGFQGIGVDHAYLFHMLIIPKKLDIDHFSKLTFLDIPLLKTYERCRSKVGI